MLSASTRRSLVRGVCSVAAVVSDSLWPMDWSPPGSSVDQVLQARTLEQVVVLSSWGSSQTRNRTPASPALQADSLPSEPARRPYVRC